jgi:hypothetical protein
VILLRGRCAVKRFREDFFVDLVPATCHTVQFFATVRQVAGQKTV